MIPCKSWRDCGLHGGGCCDAGIYNKPSYGVCLLACKHYDGPARKDIANAMLSVPVMLSTDTTTPSLPIQDRVVVPSTKYLGDRMGAAIGKMTGRKPCSGCRKVEGGLNWAHRSLEKLLT